MVSVVRRLVGHFRRYRITPSSIWLRQPGGWVEIRRGDIAALKFETVSRIIVRYFNGQRFIVSLYQFSNPAYDAVCRSLRDSMQHNERTRGLWQGAKVLKHYG
jgi:hypothetical protein